MSKRNSSSSSVGAANDKQLRKSAKSCQDKKEDVEKKKGLEQHIKSSKGSARDNGQSRDVAQVSDVPFGAGSGGGENRKQNHCEIEKRRRDKMNYYIMQLASVIPPFNNSSNNSNQSKIDKLTVLRLAVQHVKSLRSSLCSFSSFHLRPSFLSSGNLLKNLILQMASQEAQDNFFMVVSCDRGKVLFVSQSSKEILNQDQNELVGQCLFDLLHKDDVNKVKEQISYFNLMPKEMLVDSKTLQPIKHNQRSSLSLLQNQSNSTPQPGSRRSFFCRMRSGRNSSAPARTTSAPLAKHASKRPNLAATNTFSADASNKDNENRANDQRRQQQTQQQQQQQASPESLSSPTSNSSNTTETTKTIDKSKSNRFSVGDGANKSRTETKADSPLEASQAQVGSNNTVATNQVAVKSLSSPKLNPQTRRPKLASVRTNASESYKKHLRYTVMHCTGYLRAINLRDNELDDEDFDDYNSEENSLDEEELDARKTVNCLVAVCRRSPLDRDLKPDRPLTFTCRYSMEGKFVFVDQRTTVALGYTPQQLLGTSHYAYCHKDSVNTFKECHRQCILKSESVSSDIYQFKRANGQYLWLQTSLKSFRNPWTELIDYIVASHTTAEGNGDPHYNEGCVPTKFNQDMTGEASQSSSPASSSLSLPSMDSKKSSSPSSSSGGSSYSMESYVSGASVQALLNQIDRMNSGGLKHSLELSRRGHLVRSSGGSAKKSNEDSGNYSDPQSCSSFSSNSAMSTNNEYMSVQGVGNFPENANNNLAHINSAPNGPFKQATQTMTANMSNYQANLVNTGQVPSFDQTMSAGNKLGPVQFVNRQQLRLTTAANMKQHQKLYNNHQYHYKTPAKSCSSTSGVWSNSSGSVYSENTSQTQAQNQVSAVTKEAQHQAMLCDVMSDGGLTCPRMNKSQEDREAPYVMQESVDSQPIRMATSVQAGNAQTQMEPQLETSCLYPNNLMPVGSYFAEDVNARYSDHQVGLNQMEQVNNDLGQNITMTMQHETVQADCSSSHINVPVMWNQETETNYQNLQQIEDNGKGGQICQTGAGDGDGDGDGNGDVTLISMDVGNSNSQIIPQPVVHCQQCANHKCSNQQAIFANSTDLNSINLTSLLADCDLDEDQLLEYLTGCDPEVQPLNMQNNAFPQYNIYNN